MVALCQRAINGEVLVRHVPLRLSIDLSEESLGHVAGQQTVAVLGKHRMIPHPIIHAQANEPAKQQVVRRDYQALLCGEQ